jgi:hypothetical protein
MINYSWELNSYIQPSDYLDFGAPSTDTRSEWVRSNLSASLAAPLRVVAPSLPRIVDT